MRVSNASQLLALGGLVAGIFYSANLIAEEINWKAIGTGGSKRMLSDARKSCARDSHQRRENSTCNP